MEKLSSNMSISELVRRTDAIVKEQMIAEVKDKIRERKILPILKDGKLSIYKISGKETLSELCDDYIDSMSDTYKRIVLSSTYDSEENFLHGAYIHERFTDSYRKCLNFFKDMTEHRPSTAEEIWKEFDLDNKRSRKLFIAENAKKIEVLIPIDDTTYTKGYRFELFQEIVHRIASSYVTCTYGKTPKLVDITNFIKRYFDLDLIASQTVEFLYSKKESFSTGMDTGKIQQKSKIERRQFTDKEKALSENEKIALLKNIKDALSIECVYSEDIDKTPDSLLESMLGTNSKEIIMDFSKHNADILYNSDFSPIYSKIMSSDSKSISSDSKVLEKKID